MLQNGKASANFKKIVYERCMQQRYRDYYIRISDLVKANDTLGFWTAKNAQIVKEYVDRLICANSAEPIIFIPSLEDKPETYARNMEFPIGEPVAVVGEEYRDATEVAPSYKLNTSNLLTSRNVAIDEATAWNTDTWVIELEEVVSEDNMVVGKNPTDGVEMQRVDGGIEYVGNVQVTDLGEN
jgi:hypothetical protein